MRETFAIVWGVTLCGLALASEPTVATPPETSAPPVNTFSIVARDPATGEWGVAVASRVLGVGSVVPWAKAGVGAIATQSYANVTFGPRGLELIASGKSAQETLDQLLADDPRREIRQVGIIDASGKTATFTGKKCIAWAGSKTGENYACQGNLLAGEKVIAAMAETFEKSRGRLVWRLASALEAGEAAGGDKRGKQSAALLVVRDQGGYAGLNDRMIDLRVDDHEEPVRELLRILNKAAPRPKPAPPTAP